MEYVRELSVLGPPSEGFLKIELATRESLLEGVPRRRADRRLNKREEFCFLKAVVRRGRDFDLAILVFGHVAYTLHDANINSACR